MIKIHYINENNELTLAKEVQTVKETLISDYEIWRDLKKSTMIEYKGYFNSICSESDFIENERELTEWINDIDNVVKNCLEFED